MGNPKRSQSSSQWHCAMCIFLAEDDQSHPGLPPPPPAGGSCTGDDGDYKERNNVNGLSGGQIPVCAFDCVPEECVNDACWVAYKMLEQGDQDVVRRMVDKGCKIGIFGRDQVTSDVPGFEHLADITTADGRSFDDGTRGVGGTPWLPTTTVAEENISMEDDEHYGQESILVHEFGHAVMECGFDDSQLDRVKAAYQAAVDAGHDTSLYMFSSEKEFWANGTQAWFEGIVRTDVNDGIITRSDVEEQLPELADLMKEVYGESDWTYVSTCRHPW